ncbi:MAG: hypothetical protein JJU12_03135 [Chlamydiales bacterium]|nr:hypothetical protein [Chlamydiales bacterium]
MSRSVTPPLPDSFSFTPSQNNVTPRKVATVAAAVLLTCILALTACILISQYPAASSAFITTFSILGIGSLITLSIALCKHYKKPIAFPFKG